ncbi:D-2-hydroxyglutarate dehydrogenase, mitochondrial [Glycine max]|nr:D-2-hydroxyglutarate dehydrogenase, mitochondrial [Glycine max]
MAGSVQRNPRFSKLNDDDVRYFEGILGTKNVVQDEGKLVTSNTDWMHKYKGSSKLLLQPRTADQVSQILKYCNSRNLAVVPQGGNTGLVGILSQIEPYVYEWTSERRGSISAEHGLGLMKANEIFYSKSRETVQVMASIKNMLDPNHILNPYKVLPHSLIS